MHDDARPNIARRLRLIVEHKAVMPALYWRKKAHGWFNDTDGGGNLMVNIGGGYFLRRGWKSLDHHSSSYPYKVDYRATILRFATAFGLAPRMRFDLTVNEFTREMYLGRELLVYDSHTWRPYCHLGDFCEVIGRVLEAPERDVAFQVFNAGGDAGNFTKQMIVDAVLEFLPDAPVRYENRGRDTRNYRVDFARIRTVLDFEPRFAVQDGIAELIAALDRNRFDDVDARPNFYGNYEIDYPVAAVG